jgi:DNA-binding GntR family transcriptional regulator
MTVLQLRASNVVGAPLGQHAADSIRDAILQGSLQPGERLVETTIASQLNLSRGPVRDALRQLALEGLVEIVPRRGTFVSRLDRADIREISTLRAVIEGLAARLLAERRDQAAIDHLEELLDEMTRAGDADPVRFATFDLKFHETLVRASGHRRLYQSWNNLRTQIWMFIRETRLGNLRSAEDTRDFHQTIVRAIRAGDAVEAERAARHHSESTGPQLVDSLTR